ncbi:DUF523 domain-containing protein [Thalassotalea agariperforans]
MHKILISACLLGENVRYNGIIKKLEHQVLKQWQAENRLVVICPEVVGGLSTPRAPAEYNKQLDKVITSTGADVTHAFQLGAKTALTLCKNHHIEFALLKESSPSCGSHTIYDGSFSQQKIAGAGITTQLLRKNNIRVYSEENIAELIADLKLRES